MEPSDRIGLSLTVYETVVLPLNYDGAEPLAGIEPASLDYKTSILDRCTKEAWSDRLGSNQHIARL